MEGSKLYIHMPKATHSLATTNRTVGSYLHLKSKWHITHIYPFRLYRVASYMFTVLSLIKFFLCNLNS
jgi:hypothetical protein